MPRATTAILLVAGVGRRLGADAAGLPKCLVPLGNGETLLHRAATALRAVGVQRIVLATGYQSEAVADAARHLPLPSVLCHNPDYAHTQNAVSLLRCREAVVGEPFFKLDGDVLFPPEVLLRLTACDAPVAVAVDRDATLAEEEMKVRIRHDDQVEAVGKGLDPALAHGETLGIERFSAEAGGRLFTALQEAVSRGRTDIYYEDVYEDLLADGVAFEAVDVSGLPWTEVDTPEDLALARSLVQGG